MRRGTPSPAAPLLLLALLAAIWGGAAAAIFAVDLGSEFLKVSIVKPGRTPISIVINEISKRKTAALVGFVGGDRLVGEEAAGVAARYPDRVFSRLRDLLGRPADDPALTTLLQRSALPFELAPAANRSWAAAVRVEEEAYSAEELVASLLEYAKGLAIAAAEGSPVSDCVLTVPPYFTPAQRQALLDAAQLAGLNVMGLIHTHAAAALQYGIERDFTNRTEHVLFYDLGAGSLEAALVRYSAYPDKRGVSVSQFEVVDVAWVENAGGDVLEGVLLEQLAKEAGTQLGKDVRGNPRAMAKLRAQVKRAKQILSANNAVPIIVEELVADADFRSSLTREQLEELAGDFWERITLPLTTLLARNNLTAGDLAAVELLGGTSRVPRVKQALSEALGGRQLDMHMDADEAVVLGAGLFAANLSTTFRLRQFGMTDKVPYSVSFSLDGEQPAKVLVPAMRRMPTKRVITKHNQTADSITVDLTFDNLPGAVLPCCHHHFPLGSYQVSGIQSVIAKYNESGKVSIHAHVDQRGVFSIARAESVIEQIEFLPDEPPAAANATANGTANGTANSTEAAGGTASDGAEAAAAADEGSQMEEDAAGSSIKSGAAAQPSEAEEVLAKMLRTRKHTLRVPLNVTGGLATPGMSREQLDASRRVLRTLRLRDEAKRDTARARNDLEAYIIATRDQIESNEEVAGATSPEQREAFKEDLTEGEDWLYGDEGDSASADQYRARLKALKSEGDPIFDRVKEGAGRGETIKQATELVDRARKAAKGWPTDKPWLNATDIEALKAKVDEFEKWLWARLTDQSKREPHQDPAFRNSEVYAKVAQLDKAFAKLNNKRQPRPPPPPKPAANTTAGNDTASNSTASNSTESVGGEGSKADPAGEKEQQAQAEGQQKEAAAGDGADGHDEL